MATLLGSLGGTSPARAGPRASSAPVEHAPASASPARGATIFLPRQSVWHYHAEGVDLGTAWRDASFDDAAWPHGPGILGFGETYIATVVPSGPDPNNRYRTTYFRTRFEVLGDPAALRRLDLLANYDDGFVAYLNGQEIARRALPAGDIAYATFALQHEGGGYEFVDLTASLPLLAPGWNVLAVEVHQSTANSSDLVLDMELAGSDQAVRIRRGPYLQQGTPNDIVVRWRTDAPAEGHVLYGPSPDQLTASASHVGLETDHEVALTGLLPATRYFYAVGTSDGVLAGGDSAHAFTTSPWPGAYVPVRFWVLGDSGLPGPDGDAVRDAYLAYASTQPADLMLMVGDNAYPAGTDAEYQTGLFDRYATTMRQTVLWPTRGNHDVVYAGPANDYYDFFTLPVAAPAGGAPSGTEAYYAFDYGDIHFICLDSEGSDLASSGPMATWLATDLAANRRSWTIAFCHHPPYTKGSHDSDNPADSNGKMIAMRANILPILEAWGVDLVLTGHSHSYERSYLLDRHYGPSTSLVPASMLLDTGDGDPLGHGAYRKRSPGRAPHEGAVHAVVGSSARLGGGPFNHPVMHEGLNVLGSLVVDVWGTQLDAVFLDAAGSVRDAFRIWKGVATSEAERRTDRPGLTFWAGPNPSRGDVGLSFAADAAARARVHVFDAAGRRIRELFPAPVATRDGTLAWDRRDERGREVAAGLYVLVLETPQGRAARKVVLLEGAP